MKATRRGEYSSSKFTRATILDAAAEILQLAGYHGISLRNIAEVAGVSHGTVLYHFPDRNILIRSLVADWEEALGFISCTLSDDGSELVLTGAKITSYQEILLRLMHLAKLPNIQRILQLTSTFITEGSNPKHPAHNYFANRHQLLIKLLEDTVKAGRREGIFTYSVSSRHLATTIATLWYGHTMAARYALTTDDLIAVISSFLAACLHHSGLSSTALMQLSAIVPNSIGDVYLETMRHLRDTFKQPLRSNHPAESYDGEDDDKLDQSGGRPNLSINDGTLCD